MPCPNSYTRSRIVSSGWFAVKRFAPARSRTSSGRASSACPLVSSGDRDRPVLHQGVLTRPAEPPGPFDEAPRARQTYEPAERGLACSVDFHDQGKASTPAVLNAGRWSWRPVSRRALRTMARCSSTLGGPFARFALRWLRCLGLPRPQPFRLQSFEDAFSSGRVIDQRVAFL
jgi:hypothetical protein